MKTEDTDYGKYFPLEDGGFPEEYPYKDPFHTNIQKMGMFLRYIKNPENIENEFLDMMEMLHDDGFTTFYKHCWNQYETILRNRIKDIKRSRLK